MNRIFDEVANRYNVTPEEVKREMAETLRLAKENPSPTARAFWGSIDENAEIEEIIAHIVKRVGLVV